MNKIEYLTDLDSIHLFIHTNELALLYISQPNCSVCHAMLPKVEKLIQNYPDIQMAHIDASEVEEVAGQFSIFTVPVILLFVNGKEHIREARIIHMDLLDQKINKIYTLFK